jgi:tRNA(adenine34) deaminase
MRQRVCALCFAPIAQLDRATDYESVGQRFESSWAHHFEKTMVQTAHKTDENFMRLALAEAEKAAACGETPVGAVLIMDGEVVAASHNMRETWQDPTAHAETIALREASVKLSTWRLSDATLYVTLEPCLMCAGALVLARVSRLVYGCRDPKAGALGSVYDVVRDGRLNHVYRITPGILEAECREVLTTFFTKLRSKSQESDAVGSLRLAKHGEVAERLKAAVSKTVVGVTPPGVQIPPSPP